MFKRIILFFIEDCLRNLSGPVGIRLRRAYYQKRLKSCGKNLVIETGVMLTGAQHISLGDNVWIDRNVSLIAGPLGDERLNIRRIQGPVDIHEGEISIGNCAHIGIGTIIQGHGGVRIDDFFTTSAYVKIYAYSNDVRRSTAGTIRTPDYEPHYILSPVRIENNVWLGLGVTLVGGHIGQDCFAKPNAVITSDFQENSILAGNPAQRQGKRFHK